MQTPSVKNTYFLQHCWNRKAIKLIPSCWLSRNGHLQEFVFLRHLMTALSQGHFPCHTSCSKPYYLSKTFRLQSFRTPRLKFACLPPHQWTGVFCPSILPARLFFSFSLRSRISFWRSSPWYILFDGMLTTLSVKYHLLSVFILAFPRGECEV